MTMQPKELAQKIAAIADDKKGNDILLLNMEGISYMTDYFVIASASNTTLVRWKTNWRKKKSSAGTRKAIKMATGYYWISATP